METKRALIEVLEEEDGEQPSGGTYGDYAYAQNGGACKDLLEKIQDEEIRKHIPLRCLSLEEMLGQFEASKQPGSGSFGMCVEADGSYVGDVWCYGIDEEEEKMAMFSFLIFEKSLWGKGVGSEAARLFCREALSRYEIRKLGAFTYAENIGSLKALEKAGFLEKERFLEEGRLSVYLEWQKY